MLVVSMLLFDFICRDDRRDNRRRAPTTTINAPATPPAMMTIEFEFDAVLAFPFTPVSASGVEVT
jgi:hypothetical protein